MDWIVAIGIAAALPSLGVVADWWTRRWQLRVALLEHFIDKWDRLDDATVPDILRLTVDLGIAVWRRVLGRGRWSWVKAVFMVVSVSGLLTTLAITLGKGAKTVTLDLFLYMVKSIFIGQVARHAQNVILLNLLFDTLTVIATVSLIRQIHSNRPLFTLGLIVSALFVATLLAWLCLMTIYVGIEDESLRGAFHRILGLIQDLPSVYQDWQTQGGVPKDQVTQIRTNASALLYASTTLIPIIAYSMVAILLLILKGIVDFGRWALMTILEKITEQELGVFTRIGYVLCALMLIFKFTTWIFALFIRWIV
jgi:hypothetical protein